MLKIQKYLNSLYNHVFKKKYYIFEVVSFYKCINSLYKIETSTKILNK